MSPVTKRLGELLQAVASREKLPLDVLTRDVRDGRMVILRSRRHRIDPLAVGSGTRVKINANIGTSPDRGDLREELEKLKVAVAAGADTVMDLSVGPKVDETRRAVVEASPVPVGTVPVYQVALDCRRRGRSFIEARPSDFLRGLEKHLRDGVDFVTVHCGVRRADIETAAPGHRLCGVVSRGGAMTIEWMAHNRSENPYYEHYDELLAMAKDWGVVLSLGDGLRPGALADATDEAQVRELVAIGELVARARSAGVAAMVEGPGHVPLDQVEANVRLEKAVCGGAPFYVLGPLVTDVGCGHDHVSAAIGGALAAFYGADFLCYVTPSEHLSLPTIEDVRIGVIASRIAAHAADVARGLPGAREWDDRMSRARAELDWDAMIKASVDPVRARSVLAQAQSRTSGACTMCGEFCAVKRSQETFKARRRRQAT